MKAFEWHSPTTVAPAVKLLRVDTEDVDEAPRPLAGGQDLLTTMKERLTRPVRMVNLKAIKGLNAIDGDAKRVNCSHALDLAEIQRTRLVGFRARFSGSGAGNEWRDDKTSPPGSGRRRADSLAGQQSRGVSGG
jgi:hypothetical protein